MSAPDTPPPQDRQITPSGPSAAADAAGLAGAGAWQVVGLPAFADNYLWVLHDGSRAVVVDPGDASVIATYLHAHELTLDAILCTHHHADHVGGVAALCAEFPAALVCGPDDARIPHCAQVLGDGDTLELSAGSFQVMAVPGHTRSHLAYLWQDRIFCGDTLFALGCGRLFEGRPDQMHDSLSRLAALSGERWVHCAHEYTLANLAFALQVDGGNPDLLARAERERARRAKGEATVPSRLDEERRTNPFLRSAAPTVRASAEQWHGGLLADEVAVFAAVRQWKDNFRS
jgi:hydroxyacylglutathione hydrolase